MMMTHASNGKTAHVSRHARVCHAMQEDRAAEAALRAQEEAEEVREHRRHLGFKVRALRQHVTHGRIPGAVRITGMHVWSVQGALIWFHLCPAGQADA